ncbi:DUF262 and DUF1524 domain-containing protein [Rhodococcus marinonascens]|uniref:DUF262 and DUF1524 domain-containing protein n=1 Tax=Rhodococcus marinonascens TaxID=38311 RepID=UPI000933C328|nr:DUF262 and DUF1524 domain-containing protein [Rhodococcus marinonascens]
MKASESSLMELLYKGDQFEIPIYQRTYSWTVDECSTLWEDILRAGGNDRVGVHFVGSVVHISKGQSNLTKREPLLVIDGQQRLTSVTLLVHALADELEKQPQEKQQPIDGYSPNKLRNRYLQNADEDDDRRYKLLLTQTDRTTLMAIVDGRERPKDYSQRIDANHTWFVRTLDEFVQGGGDLARVCRGLAKLMVVDIALTRDQENPQLIFESMNSTGKELSQADLIRNFVLMGLPTTIQTRLYERHWRPMELDFGQDSYATHFDSFVRNYLTVRTGAAPRRDHVYVAFKKYSREVAGPEGDVNDADHLDAVLGSLRAYGRYYGRIALGGEENSSLREAFNDFNELKADTAYPAILEMYDDYERGLLSLSDFVAAVRLIESYVFRRGVCGVPTNSLNLTFANLIKNVDKTDYLNSLRSYFLTLSSYKAFPTDETFAERLTSFDAYHFQRRLYLLRRLENWDTKEPASVAEYTIEHIMPQNPELSARWRDALGEDWERVQDRWLHTLGNLTLTGYNSEYSDRPFADKRDMKGGFKDSPLRLNKGLRDLSQWNEESIVGRGEDLAKRAVDVWSRPVAPEGAIGVSRRSSQTQVRYTIDDYEHLKSEHTRGIHDALIREVNALDPSIVVEFRKVYIGLVANGTFADLVPQARGLRIQLHIPFPEVDDPKGICTDVSDVGRWGSGETRFLFSHAGELQYVMGLVRQAFDRQLEVE